MLLTRILPYEDRTYESVLRQEKTGQCKPVFLDILCTILNRVQLHKLKKNMYKKVKNIEIIMNRSNECTLFFLSL